MSAFERTLKQHLVSSRGRLWADVCNSDKRGNIVAAKSHVIHALHYDNDFRRGIFTRSVRNTSRPFKHQKSFTKRLIINHWSESFSIVRPTANADPWLYRLTGYCFPGRWQCPAVRRTGSRRQSDDKDQNLLALMDFWTDGYCVEQRQLNDVYVDNWRVGLSFVKRLATSDNLLVVKKKFSFS